MSIKKSKYFELEYTEKDEEYIDELFEYVEDESKYIVSFFDIDNFDNIVYIKLFDNLNTFRKECSKVKGGLEVPLWLCGLSFRRNGIDRIYALCLEEYKKTDGHNNCILEDLKRLIIHEFVHNCHRKYTNIKLPMWLGDGLATYLSHQYDGDNNLTFNASLDEVINGGVSYKNYYIMFSYALNNYGKDYILGLLKDEEFLKEETVKLYNEVSSFYKNKSR